MLVYSVRSAFHTEDILTCQIQVWLITMAAFRCMLPNSHIKTMLLVTLVFFLLWHVRSLLKGYTCRGAAILHLTLHHHIYPSALHIVQFNSFDNPLIRSSHELRFFVFCMMLLCLFEYEETFLEERVSIKWWISSACSNSTEQLSCWVK